MSLSAPIAAELKAESATTRRVLERVPEASFQWKPHEKSMPLGRLAGHIAELPSLAVPVAAQPELDFGAGNFTPFVPKTSAELLDVFDRNLGAALAAITELSDDQLFDPWRLRSGDRVIFEGPRIAVLRSLCLSHVIHHRGQLSVYLRLLDVSVPSIYGPSADERAGF